MQRIASPPSAVPRHTPRPVAVTHAEFLIAAYGRAQAVQIAEVNSRLTGSDSYWSLVFEAARQLRNDDYQ
jgi:hypothetical protein